MDQTQSQSTTRTQTKQTKQDKKNVGKITKELQQSIKHTQKEQDTKEKQQYVYQILKYQDSPRFGNFVKTNLKINFSESALQKKKCVKLKDILDRIRINLDNRNLDNFYKAMLVNATISFEKLMDNFYSIEGFSDSLMKNPHFLDCVERYKIENIGRMPAIPPSLQIIFIMSQTAMICHEVSKQKTNEEYEMKAPKLSKQEKDLLHDN